jgi:two-component system cell cycle sensor histidine kinase/response regulator CckA
MQSVGRLAGGVAHDFNNMLGVILGYTEMALGELSPAQPLYANFKEIKKAAERCADLTRQLLAFASRQVVAPKIIDLNQTVEEMYRLMRQTIGDNIELAWLPGADLWSVNMDPTQIGQILANLCDNASDAIAGLGTITIKTVNSTLDEAHCAEHPWLIPGDYVQLTVSDSGCGIDKEVIDNLFEPFFTTKEMSKHSGLGLATVYGAVKQNGGFIDVSSEPEQGTTFTIYLPRYVGMERQEKTEKVVTISHVQSGNHTTGGRRAYCPGIGHPIAQY